MNGIKQAKSVFIQDDTQCTCFNLVKPQNKLFTSQQQNKQGKPSSKIGSDLYSNLAVKEARKSTKRSLRKNSSEKMLLMFPSQKNFADMQIQKIKKKPFSKIKNPNSQLLNLQNKRINQVQLKECKMNIIQKQAGMNKNSSKVSSYSLFDSPKINQPISQKLQIPIANKQYFLSSLRDQLGYNHSLSPKLCKQIPKTQKIQIKKYQGYSEDKNVAYPKVHSLKNAIKYSHIINCNHPNNQSDFYAQTVKKSDNFIKFPNQYKFNTVNNNKIKQNNETYKNEGSKRQLSKSELNYPTPKIKTQHQAIQNIISRRQKQISQAKINKPPLNRFKLKRNTLFKMTDLEEICSLHDEDDRTNSDKQSIVVARLNEYGSLNDFKTEDALTAYSNLVTRKTQNSVIGPDFRSFFWNNQESLIPK